MCSRARKSSHCQVETLPPVILNVFSSEKVTTTAMYSRTMLEPTQLVPQPLYDIARELLAGGTNSGRAVRAEVVSQSQSGLATRDEMVCQPTTDPSRIR